MSWLETTWFELKRSWLATLAIGAIVAVVVGMEVWDGSQIAVQGEPRVATITAFSSLDTSSKYSAGKISVYAVSSDGLRGMTHVTPGRLRGCKVGDLIAADRVGGRLRLRPSPCTGEAP